MVFLLVSLVLGAAFLGAGVGSGVALWVGSKLAQRRVLDLVSGGGLGWVLGKMGFGGPPGTEILGDSSVRHYAERADLEDDCPECVKLDAPKMLPAEASHG